MTEERIPALAAADDLPEIVRKVRARTPARLLAGRTGAAYRTGTQLELREAHAAARDAVRDELDVSTLFDADFIQEWNLLEVRTQANTKDEYLLRPDLGRHFDGASAAAIKQRCARHVDIQIAIGDGLSVPAIAAQVPGLLPVLCAGAAAHGWSLGRNLVIRHCRVGILNEIGEVLNPRIAVLLIGERPGLATTESLSAYMAYRPNGAHSDADRNLISNIHARGLDWQTAAIRILDLAARMVNANLSGYRLPANTSGLPDSLTSA
jgi:ethanolamine ammonia-lyase small subunit